MININDFPPLWMYDRQTDPFDLPSEASSTVSSGTSSPPPVTDDTDGNPTDGMFCVCPGPHGMCHTPLAVFSSNLGPFSFLSDPFSPAPMAPSASTRYPPDRPVIPNRLPQPFIPHPMPYLSVLRLDKTFGPYSAPLSPNSWASTREMGAISSPSAYAVLSPRPTSYKELENVTYNEPKFYHIPLGSSKPKTSRNQQNKIWKKSKRTIRQILTNMDPCEIEVTLEELMQINIVRSRGIFCIMAMEFQATNVSNTCAYATLFGALNLPFPMITHLLTVRCLVQVTKLFSLNNFATSKPLVLFIAHMVNQNIVSHSHVIELINECLEKPTYDSMKLVLMILEICGTKVNKHFASEIDMLMDRFRKILKKEEYEKSEILYIVYDLLKLHENGFDSENRPKLNNYAVINSIRQIPIVIRPHCLDLQLELNSFLFDVFFDENESYYFNVEVKSYHRGYNFWVDKQYSCRIMQYFPPKLCMVKCPNNRVEDYECDEQSAVRVLATIQLMTMKKTVNQILKWRRLNIRQYSLKRERRTKKFNYCCDQHAIYRHQSSVDQENDNELQTIDELFTELRKDVEDIIINMFEENYQFVCIDNEDWLRAYIDSQLVYLLRHHFISWTVLSRMYVQPGEGHAKECFIQCLFQNLLFILGVDKLLKYIGNPLLRSSLKRIFVFDGEQRLSRRIIRLFYGEHLDIVLTEYEKSLWESSTDPIAAEARAVEN